MPKSFGKEPEGDLHMVSFPNYSTITKKDLETITAETL